MKDRKGKLWVFVVFLVNSSWLIGQYTYEPDTINPYGLPNPQAAEEIRDYQEMIGVCDCLSYRTGKDGQMTEPVSMIWEFRYIMNGMGVQDLTLKEDGSHSGSIRQYNSEEGKWYVHYYTSVNPSPTLGTWEGRRSNDSIVLRKEQKAPNGMEGFYKITFKNISPKGFNWTGEWVNPDETFKLLTWKIDCVKRQE